MFYKVRFFFKNASSRSVYFIKRFVSKKEQEKVYYSFEKKSTAKKVIIQNSMKKRNLKVFIFS